MAKKKLDLRFNDYREAIIEIGNALESCELNNRALALLVADSCSVNLGQVMKVLDALPKLKQRYLKKATK